MVLRSPRKLMAIALALVLGVAIMTPGPIGATSEVIIFVTWHPDGTLLAVGNQNTVQILDTATTQVLNVFSDLEMQATAPRLEPRWGQARHRQRFPVGHLAIPLGSRRRRVGALAFFARLALALRPGMEPQCRQDSGWGCGRPGSMGCV